MESSFLYISTLYVSYASYISYVYEGGPKKWQYVYKNLCIYPYLFKLQSLSKYSQFNAMHLFRLFFPMLKTVFELIDFDTFLCFCHFFSFISSTSAKWFSLGAFLSTQRKIGWIGKVKHGVHGDFVQKLVNIQHGVGRGTHQSPIMKWENTLNVKKKKITEAECSLSQCKLVHWYRWVPRTLT